jgi:hypothetical protein
MPDPVVFISSTSEDLEDYRKQAASAARACGFSPKMMEYFPASGHRPSLQACLEMVGQAELLVVIVAHRYGWVPDDPVNTDAKSITWLECDEARRTGKEVLALLVEPGYKWPAELKESYRVVEAMQRAIDTVPEIVAEVKRNEEKLQQFKAELSRYFRVSFTEPLGFRALVSEALGGWSKRHPSITITPPGDPEIYLKTLEDDTRQIRIRGLTSKRAEPYFFGIDEIYIPLKTIETRERKGKTEIALEEQRRIVLESALSQRRLVIVGDPGSGKSTFLRRVAFELCRTLRGTRPEKAAPFLAENDTRFPILIRIGDLAKLLATDKSPKAADSPDWIPYFLGKQSDENKWGLKEEFFRRKLESGDCLVMLDGLDEAPERRLRERISRVLEKSARAFEKCSFLVTTREASYAGDAVLEQFQALRIGDLEPPEIAFFFEHFARGLALNETETKKFKQELQGALDGREEIREMARNPVMLTALAVLQHNDQRLPEYRVELYGSILGWLAAAREQKEGRPAAEKCLEYMRKLALAMQDAPSGRLVQINKRAAAEHCAEWFGGTADANEELLERETQDSGILSSLGVDLKFWHLSFQEYLAAREIASLTEKQQIEKVIAGGKLYLPEWREMMRLLGGVLRLQGEAKIEALFCAILDRLGERPKLVEQARCAALLGTIMRDLSRMGYKPATPKYEQTVKAVMGIFDARQAEKIDVQTRIEAAEALGQVGDPRLEEDNWVTISAGPATRAFQIGRFPVTVQEFAAFIKAGGYSVRKYWRSHFNRFPAPTDWRRQMQHPNWPVTGVSWYEASAYCAWKGVRLPSAAEWNQAATGTSGADYPWGNEPPNQSHAIWGEFINNPTPVGLFPRGNTAEGVCDMFGNVSEWCHDLDDSEKGWRKTRGASWDDEPWGSEGAAIASERFEELGFRCVRDLKTRGGKSSRARRKAQ